MYCVHFIYYMISILCVCVCTIADMIRDKSGMQTLQRLPPTTNEEIE